MGRDEALTQKREAILERWLQAVLATYPEETVRFLRRDKNRFSNPVGNTVIAGLTRLYDALVDEQPTAALAPALDGIVRIRAVQEFAPSAAVGFVYDLKPILREELAGAGLAPEEWAALDAGVDRMALLAFDIYMQCRETLFQIRIREIRDYQLMAERAGGCAPAMCGGSQSTVKEGR